MEIMRCTVRRQQLDVDVPTLVALTYDYINVKATFSSEWAGMQKWLHIRNVENQSIIAHVLFSNDEIGEDVGLNLTAGEWDVWIHGALYEDNTLIKRITTNVKKIKVEATGSEDEILPSIGPSVAEQAVAAAERAEAAADDAEDSAEAAAGYAQSAQEDATDAQTYAAAALQSMSQANDGANEARNSAFNAEQYSILAASAVTHYPKIVNNYWYVWDVTNETWTNTGVMGEGATFTPSVDEYGVLSWTNNAGLPNPTPVNIVSLFNDLPELQAKMDEILAEAEAGIGDIEAQRDTILQSIASVADLGTDTTLSSLGMAADAKVTGLAVKASDAVAMKSLNFMGYDSELLSWEQGGINRNTGNNVASDAVIRTSNYLNTMNIYDFDVEIPEGYRFVLLRYDGDYVYKSSDEYTTTKTHINTRERVGYMYRFVFAENSANPRNIYPQEGVLFTIRAYQNSNTILKLASPSSQYLDTTVLLQKVSGVTKFPGNLFDPTNALNDYYIRYSDGDRRSLSGYYATGWIPVTAGHTYKANHGRGCAWYDSSYTYISGIQGTNIQSGITAPENAAYIRFSLNKSTDTSNLFDVYFADINDYDAVVRIDDLVAEPIPWCEGKTIAWLGDSIVHGSDFDDIVAQEMGMTLVDMGEDGATIAYNSSGTRQNIELNELDTLISNGTAVDIIAISAGSNDYQYTYTNFGSLSLLENNNYNNTTFYGALAKLCDKLIANYPQKIIFFTTPIKRAQPFTGSSDDTTPFSKNGNDKTLMDYCDAIKEVCGYYSIPVLDLNRESLLNPHIAAQQNLFVDNDKTHPNNAGRKIMARRVSGWLTQLGYKMS